MAANHLPAYPQVMKHIPEKKPLTFGDFIMGVYDAWGKRRARGVVWLAVNTRLVAFRGRRRFIIF